MNIVLENVLMHSERWSRLDFYKMYWWFILNATVENILMQKENAALETYWCKSKRRRVAVVAWPFLPCMYDPALLRPFWFVRWMVRFETALMTVSWSGGYNTEKWQNLDRASYWWGPYTSPWSFSMDCSDKIGTFHEYKGSCFLLGCTFYPSYIEYNDSQWRKKQNKAV